MKRMSQKLLMLALVASMAWFTGCEDSPTDSGSSTPDPTPEFKLSEGAESGAKASFQMVRTMQTQNKLLEAVEGNPLDIDDIPEAMVTLKDVQMQADRVSRVQEYALQSGNFSKMMGDSLIWSETWDDPVSGTAGKREFYYDSETEIARVLEVITQFPSQVDIDYDSTEIRAFVGPDLGDDSDDRVLSLAKLTRFTPGFFVEKVEGNGTVTAWTSENDIAGADVTNMVTYGPQNEIEKLTESASWNENGTGSLSERVDYRDGTFLSRNVTFSENFEGTFSEVWRDGTTANGTFDLLEDDNHASITNNIDFAANPYIDRLEQAVDYTFVPEDSSSNARLVERLFFPTGELDTTSVDITRRPFGDHVKEEYDIRTTNDGLTHLWVEYYETYTKVRGEHDAQDGHFGTIDAIEYSDGSGEATTKIWSSRESFNNGDDPLVVITIRYSGDGTGNGTIAEGENVYDITMDSNGEIEVDNRAGESVTLSGY
ncbi:MAG: hypothetical protein AAFP70_12265 [Calditrichota bacterium]